MMNYPKKEDTEIRLSDWLWYSLEYWKQGVVFVLVITVLVTGAFYFKHRRSASGTNPDDLMSQNDSRREELQTLRDQYLSIDQALQNNLGDINGSYLMELDPYHTDTRIIQYYIALKGQKSNQEDNIQNSNALAALKQTYASAATSDSVSSYVSRKTKIASGEVSTLIHADSSSSSSSMSENGNLIITITAGSAQDCDAVEKGIDDAIQEAEEAAAAIAAHSIIRVSSTDSTGFSQTVLDQQQTRIDNLNRYQNIMSSIVTSGKDLSDEELNYVKGITDELPASLVQNTEVTGVNSFSFGKYAAIGILVGVVLFFLVSFFRYSFGTRLVCPYYAEDNYGIETTFLSDGRKKGLWRLRYRNVKCLSEENVIQTFLNSMGQTDADSVAILTSSASDRVRSFAENLTAALAQNGVRAVFLVNPSDHPKQSAEVIRGNMPIFVAEQIPCDSRLDVDEVISFVNDNELTIRGCCAIV